MNPRQKQFSLNRGAFRKQIPISFFKRLFILISILIGGLLIAVFFSPYGKQDGFSYKLVQHSVIIHAPVDSVFAYLGNSDNARNWSVYVDHIKTLNAQKIADGTIGSERRCFCYTDETGQRWDERTTAVEQNKRRQLITYNLVDFTMQADGLASEQLYERIGKNDCKLTFTLFFHDHNPSFFTELKIYLGAYKVKFIFEQNLENIKRILNRGASRKQIPIS